MRCRYTPITVAQIQSTGHSRCWLGTEQPQLSLVAGSPEHCGTWGQLSRPLRDSPPSPAPQQGPSSFTRISGNVSLGSLHAGVHHLTKHHAALHGWWPQELALLTMEDHAVPHDVKMSQERRGEAPGHDVGERSQPEGLRPCHPRSERPWRP